MIAPEGLCQLVRKAQVGDRQAWAELLQRTLSEIAHFSRHFGDASTAAESYADLTQKAALRFWERLPQFHGTTDDESTAAMLHDWLKQLVWRLAATSREARHAAKRRPELPLIRLGTPSGHDSKVDGAGLEPAGQGPTPSGMAAAGELDERLRMALQRMPNVTDREILELCFRDNLSLRAVAVQMKISYDKARERYHYALRFLENELEGLL